MKVEYLKFRKNSSLEDIKSYMSYYRGIGQVVMTVINGEKIYSNDPDFDNVFERLELGLNADEYKELKGLERDNQVYKTRMINASSIENDVCFRFYYGLAKTMIKPGSIDGFETIINRYGREFKDNLIVITQIMLALENDNKIDMYKELNRVIISIKDLSVDIDRIYMFVKDWAIKGDMLDLVFFKDTTLDYRNDMIRKLNINNKRIDEIKKR